MKKQILYFLLLFLVSCSIEKRVHLPGYHVEWHRPFRQADHLNIKPPTSSVPECKTLPLSVMNVNDYVLPTLSDSVLNLDVPSHEPELEELQKPTAQSFLPKAKRLLHAPTAPLFRSKKTLFKKPFHEKNSEEPEHNFFGWLGLACLLSFLLIYPLLLAPVFGALGIAASTFYPHLFKSSFLIWFSYVLGIIACLFLLFISILPFGDLFLLFPLALSAILISTAIVVLSKLIGWVLWNAPR